MRIIPRAREHCTVKKLQRYQLLINAEWRAAHERAHFRSINPANGEAWAEIAEAGARDVDDAVTAAAHAFATWSQLTPTARGKYLRRLGDLLVENSEQLGRVESTDTGKIFAETRWQAQYIAEYFYYYAGCADKLHGQTLPIDKADMFAFTRREPLGVVAAVVPWNSQLFLSAVKIAPALAAGNCVVLKASEHASAAILEFGKLFARAEFPPGVFNVVTGHGEPCGRALTSHRNVHRISFTGGATAAKQVVRNSAENFAQVTLELGGKSPFIVCDDAGMENAINSALAASFGAAGQSCVAGSRLLLQQGIAAEFLQELQTRAAKICIGDPLEASTQIGPLCTRAQVEHAAAEIAHAKSEGGEILCGGMRAQDCMPHLPPGGFYFPPTIVACANHNMRIVDTELFAPVACAVQFRDEQDAIQLANASQYGLAAGVFTKSNARALRIANAVRAGIVWVNTYRVISPIAEFGGFKNSGHGREGGFQAMFDYTRAKTVWMNMSEEPAANPFVMR